MGFLLLGLGLGFSLLLFSLKENAAIHRTAMWLWEEPFFLR